MLTKGGANMYKELLISSLLNLDKTIATTLFEKYTYPWEVLPHIGEHIATLSRNLDPNIYEETKKGIFIAKSANVAPSACISAPCIICENAEVRHCAFIRGNAIIGKNSVVGNSTELKNVILFDNVQVPHYNYVGDSILGYKSHMGAGSITSNVKSDKSLVEVKINGEKIKTSLKKLGAILADNVEVGCNTVLNPGSIVGRNTSIYPLSMVRGYVESDSIFKVDSKIVKKEGSR